MCDGPGTSRVVRLGLSDKTVPTPTAIASCNARSVWVMRKDSGQDIRRCWPWAAAMLPSKVWAYVKVTDGVNTHVSKREDTIFVNSSRDPIVISTTVSTAFLARSKNMSGRIRRLLGHLEEDIPVTTARLQNCYDELKFQENKAGLLLANELQNVLKSRGVEDIEITAPPHLSEQHFRVLFTADTLIFLAELHRQFDDEIDSMLLQRAERQAKLDAGHTPDFLPETRDIREGKWTISPLPDYALDRRIDIGDVSPHDTEFLLAALNSGATGVQTDFDDGHCPRWENVLQGHYNIYHAARGTLMTSDGIMMKRPLSKSAVIMHRPRAWNMMERHVQIGGREMLGALFDFGLHMFTNGALLLANRCGPFFYLSKIESHVEARLWDRIFAWTEAKLGLPLGAIKACVLIENILAAFEMHEILYELRLHCLGLNCGMWDYTASIISKFRHRPEFILPDRASHVSMDVPFLTHYRALVLATCHARGALATGGMAPLAGSYGRGGGVVEALMRSSRPGPELDAALAVMQDDALTPTELTQRAAVIVLIVIIIVVSLHDF
jgi:hypothetical protein